MLRLRYATLSLLAFLIILATSDASAQATAPQELPKKLASEIDAFIKRTEKWGYVSVKKPDIWGQARFSQHRVEFEEIMKGERTKFAVKLQGASSTSDSALAAMALSIQAALPGPQAHIIQPYEMLRRFQELKRNDVMDQNYGTTTTVDGVNTNSSITAALEGLEATVGGGTSSETTTETPEKKIFPTQLPKRDPIAIPEGPKPEDLVSGFDIISRNDSLSYTPKGFGGENGLGLEPTVVLDQHARYLNHLHSLRRINEGDDQADAPGYSLYLVRVPVSITPSKKTRSGYGAQVSLSINPNLSESFLDDTFRNLVINDVIEQLSTTIWKTIQDEKLIADYRKYPNPDIRRPDVDGVKPQSSTAAPP